MQDCRFHGQRGSGQVIKVETALEKRESRQLDDDSGRPDRIKAKQRRHYDTGSAWYKARVCLITDIARTSAIPTIPIAPPISNIT